MSFGHVLAVAALETRGLYRLGRTWVFLLWTVGIGAALFLAHAVGHQTYSGASLTQGSIAPRFLVNNVGTITVLAAMAGLILVAHDIVDKDRRDRIVDVIGTRPATNVVLLVGRLVAVVLLGWVAVVGLLLTIQAIGLLAETQGSAVAVAFEPVSLAAFLVVHSLPLLTLWCSLLILLAVVCPVRLLAVGLALTILATYATLLFLVPIRLLSLTGVPGFAEFASDVLPRFADGRTLLQRASMVVLALGLLCVAAAIQDRLDWPAPTRRLAVGASLIIVASIGVASLAVHANHRVQERIEWADVHSAHRNDPRVDVEHISGKVTIDPGRRLGLDIDLLLRVPRAMPDVVLMSFNPGMHVETVQLDGSIVPHRHAVGMLEIEIPAGTSEEVLLSLQAHGVPDPNFGYLDSIVHGDEENLAGSQLHLLGAEASIFTPGFVALMPGARWLPGAGAAFANEDNTQPDGDFFLVDLLVEVPRGWLVAGPGRRRPVVTDSSISQFAFRPSIPISDFALVASRFDRRATDVGPVEVELLLHPKHSHKIDEFAGLDPKPFLQRLLFGLPVDSGISYALDGLTIVEVPGRLRIYGGGWRMDTTLALPGVILLRERGLPTAQFHGRLDGVDSEYAALRHVSRYFAKDSLGGDFAHMLRNHILFHTRPDGESATALQFAVESLVDSVFNPGLSRFDPPFFSAHVFTAPHVGVPAASDLLARAMGNTAWIGLAAPSETKRRSAWSLLATQRATRFDLRSEPREALAALTMKGRMLGDLVVDLIGTPRTARFLGDLRRRHLGTRFGVSDFIAAANAVDPELGPLVEDWLESGSLPGFVTSPAKLSPLSDDELGRSRYEVRVHVRNEEPAPGYVRLYSDMTTYDPNYPGVSDPILIPANSAVEVGIVSLGRPRGLRLLPYLSRNAGAVDIPMPQRDRAAPTTEPSLSGFRPSSWKPTKDGIVVDDLDPGFRVDQASTFASPTWLNALIPSMSFDMDLGVPVVSGTGFVPRGLWFRKEARSCWGKYRRTCVQILPSSGHSRVVFDTQIPNGGIWQLEYHMPGQTRQGFIEPSRHRGLGHTRVLVESTAFETELAFDASEARLGWNRLDAFRLNPGPVGVAVSGDSNGEVVVADAIRWRMLSPTETVAPIRSTATRQKETP